MVEIKQASPGRWDEKGIYHLGGRVWAVNPNLTIGSKPDTGDTP